MNQIGKVYREAAHRRGPVDPMSKFTFVARMPDRPGAMHQAAEIVKRHEGNIDRIHFDRRIDPRTVFFEVTCSDEAYAQINAELAGIGYLQSSLAPLNFLRFHAWVPNRPGSLLEFLDYTTKAGANIAFMDFDDKGHAFQDDERSQERLTVSLTLEDNAAVEQLLESLKPRYRLEILEYDTTGKRLDDTVFYIRFAQEIRAIIGGAQDDFLLRLLNDINRIVQELTNREQDPKQVFDSILATGRALRETVGSGFYADVQIVPLGDEGELICFQMPCGGNVFLLRSLWETALVDTAFGIYRDDLKEMLRHHGVFDAASIGKIFVSHADADHAGGGGGFPAKSFMHPGTKDILARSNRAYGSKLQGSILEEVYTRLINLFSGFDPPAQAELFHVPEGARGAFPVIGHFRVGAIEFEVLESLGGHLHGQAYLYSADAGLLFSADSLINFSSLTEERERFARLAKTLMTSVNVDSERANAERKGLMELAAMTDAQLASQGRHCLVCGGHGAISVLENGRLVTLGKVEKYWPVAKL
jgi:glyoxylase-like metal-dependent hydrolase (beta-lactamase superfamily II)